MSRFSDEEIKRFHDEFIELKEEFEEHVDNETIVFDEILACQEENKQALAELSESTKGLLSAWASAQSVVEAGSILSKFGKWLAGLAVFGVIFKWISEPF